MQRQQDKLVPVITNRSLLSLRHQNVLYPKNFRSVVEKLSVLENPVLVVLYTVYWPSIPCVLHTAHMQVRQP